uniref:Poly [ADP-ribose] polymerase 14-like n=1 Tax=Phallusia mammillata TaxID=59560 RepID=A0A6F9DNE9_9ASCI|nr:poly [ADP-ribose] polymerase 14-like [Phallusia mammillata]
MKEDVEKMPLRDKKLKAMSLCASDCIRLGDLPSHLTKDDITREIEKFGHCTITYIHRPDSKVAFVFFSDFRDADIIAAELKKGKEITAFGSRIKSSLFYQLSPLVFPKDPENTLARSNSAIKKTKIYDTKTQYEDDHEQMEVDDNGDSGDDYSQRPSTSNTKPLTSQFGSHDLDGDISFEFKPSVPYDVMEFVHLSPEVLNTLQKKFNKLKVELTKKHANTVMGYSMFHLVKFTLPNNDKEMRNEYCENSEVFEKTCFKRVEDFLSQLSTKTEDFNFTDINAVRKNMGWDQDDANVIMVQNASNDMVQAYVKWDDIKKGAVTLSGYRNEIDDVIKILNKSVALEAGSRPSTSSNYAKRYKQPQGETPSSSSHHRQNQDPVANAWNHSSNGNFVKLDSILIPWFVKYSKSGNHMFTNVQVKAAIGGVTLIGESDAATRAKHWITEMAPQLETEQQNLDNDDDIEFLTSDKGKLFLDEVESKTKCSVFVQTKTGQSQPKISQPDVWTERQLINSDVVVRVIKVDITEHSCDAIVNASNERLALLSAGVSGSIKQKGGMEIQKEMDKISSRRGNLYPGEAVSTTAGSGNLPCNRIIHAVGPRWNAASSSNPIRDLQTCIHSCLQVAEVDGSTSIAMPAISCGVFGGKPDVCTGVIVQTITQYATGRKYSKLRRIDLVDISDDWVLTQFKLALEQLSTPLNSKNPKLSYSAAASGAGSLIKKQPTTTQMLHQASAGPVNVVVKQGDITAETCDAIVNPSSSSFDFNGQVGKIILRKGGKAIKSECHSVLKTFDWDLRVTSAGDLPSKNIIHIAMPSDGYKLTNLLVRVFDKAEKMKLNTIALPALGTGTLGGDAKHCAQILRSAVDNFATKNPKFLTNIRAVIFDRRHIETYRSVLLQDRRPAHQPMISPVDPVKFVSDDAGYIKPGLYFYANDRADIRKVKSMVAQYLKEQRSKPKIYTEEFNLIKGEEVYLQERISDVEDQFGVKIEISISRQGIRAKLVGDQENVRKARSCLKRDFDQYRRNTGPLQHSMQATTYRGEERMPQTTNQEASHWSKSYEANDYNRTATGSRTDDAKRMQSGEKNIGNRTKELERRGSSDKELRQIPLVTSDVDDDKSEEKKEVKPGARDRHRERRLDVKGAKSSRERESYNDGNAPKHDQGVRNGNKDSSRYREEMKNKPEYVPGDYSHENDRQERAFRKASTTSLPDSLEGSSSEEDRLSHDERKFDFPPKASSTFHATTSSSPSYDVEKTGQKKINDKQKSLVSKLDEGNDSDDEFVDAMDELPTPSSQGKKCVKVENMDEGNRDLGSVISNFDSNQIRNKGKGKAASDEVGEKKESEAKRPKPAPRKSQPLSGKTQSFSRSTSEENSEQTDVKKSEQNLAEKSEQNTVEKMEKSDEEKTEPRDEKMKQDFGRNPISETKNRQPALSNTEASKEMSKDSLEQKEKEKNKRGAAAKEGDRASDGRSGERKPEKQAKPLSGEGENTVNRSEERSEQGESNRERESAELNGKKKADSSGKEGPKSGGAKSNPIQKLEKEVKQGAEQINNDLAFFNLSGNRSEFTEEEWGKNWRTLKTDEWLLVNIPEGSQKYQAVVDRSGIKSGSQMPNIVQMQQIKNPKLYQKFKEEKKTKPSSKNNYHFYPIVKEDVVENLCGLGWNNSVDQSDACSSEGAAFFKDIQTPLRFAWVKNNEKQVIMADVIPDNISEHASAMLTITKNERAYPLYLLTIKP